MLNKTDLHFWDFNERYDGVLDVAMNGWEEQERTCGSPPRAWSRRWRSRARGLELRGTTGSSPALTSSPLPRTRACNLGRVEGKQSQQTSATIRDDFSFEDLHLHVAGDGEVNKEIWDTDGEKGKICVGKKRAQRGLTDVRETLTESAKGGRDQPSPVLASRRW